MHRLLEHRPLTADPPGRPENRLGIDLARRRRSWEGRPQSMGHGKKRVPFQVLDPVMAWMRRGLDLCGLYKILARRATRIQIVENDLWLVGLPGEFEGARLLHLTDLHIDGPPGFGETLTSTCRELDFDVAVITGDLRLDTRGPVDAALRELESLVPVLGACRHGAYAVLGNHDTLDMVEPLESLGLRYLLNESLRIGAGEGRGGVWLVGVDDAHFFGTDDLPAAFADVPVEDVALFLCHSPDLILEAAAAFADVYLCGHTHGGQICLPGGTPLVSNASCARRFIAGPWQYGALRGYTSRGCGFSGVPLRSFCRPEIVIHTLRAERRCRERVVGERRMSLNDPVYPDGRRNSSSHRRGEKAQ